MQKLLICSLEQVKDCFYFILRSGMLYGMETDLLTCVCAEAVVNLSLEISILSSCIGWPRAGQAEDMSAREVAAVPVTAQVTVIPGVDSLIGDLLDMDMGPPMSQQFNEQPSVGQQLGGVPSHGAVDLLGEGLDSLVCIYLFIFINPKPQPLLEPLVEPGNG
jgi:hypothetical protein